MKKKTVKLLPPSLRRQTIETLFPDRDDAAMLRKFRREMVGWHHTTPRNSIAATLKELNRGPSFLSYMELGGFNTILSRVQAWACVFDLNFEPMLFCEDGSVAPIDDEHMVMALMTKGCDEEAQLWTRRLLSSRLAKARKAAGVSRDQLGAVLGVTGKAISDWECKSSADPQVPKLFKYANAMRTLGVDGVCIVFAVHEL